ncbi:pyridoxamine 5'-phosphate oxidase family protein [Natrialba sp. SSL1]|uniref:pyridoxamine 5'-phosphate oxidase family protein n=1 Tax=Natrialba sp. SSL1 TaxID=1869245 RepID=UPI0008F879CE|nr:pyridoxamine 5'-phosphate oxidase family protein [Natrialba sp. SSL1]OIB56092.1 flavin-nucleotide-binding protein [Natrialba sp. SSL1]
MQGIRWLQLTDDERDEFLGRGGTGVLSFATDGDEPPVSIPVSYGYSEEESVLYFQLSFTPESRKHDLVDRRVSFVVHDETAAGWRSVVVTGQLAELSGEPYESAVVQGMWSIDLPDVDIFEQPREDVTFESYYLDPDRISGRKEVVTEP